jgi:dTDP-4-amino-4,6-dideoxygalactose transaminase
MKKIWLSSPHMGGTEQNFVQQAFEENWIAPLGPNVNGFESDIQNFTGVSYAAALSSGTGAIHLALDILGVGPKDIVLVQSFTFCASVNPIKYLGGEPVFIDSESETWNMCPKALQKALSFFKTNGSLDRVKAILPVHLYGMPAKMDEICAIAAEYGIPTVEDAAESIGSTLLGKHTGTFGDFGVYSFNGNKIITTSSGGALVSSSREKIELGRKLATQGRDDAPHYQHSMIGYNYRMSNVCAGIGRGQMEVLNDRISQRRENYIRYQEIFESINNSGYSIRFQEESPEAYSNRWLTAINMNPENNNGRTREELRLYLEELNIDSRPLWKPMHLQPIYEDTLYFGNSVCEDLFEHGLCLPSGSNLSKEDWIRIEDALKNFFVTS